MKGGISDMLKNTAESLPKEKIRIAKTVIVPVSQLVKAHKLIDKIERELLTLGYRDKKLIEELRDCVTVTY